MGQGAKKIIFTACHLGELKLAFTSAKSFLTSRIDFTVLLLFEFLKKHHLPIGQVTNRMHTSLIPKSLAPGYRTLLSLHTELGKSREVSQNFLVEGLTAEILGIGSPVSFKAGSVKMANMYG